MTNRDLTSPHRRSRRLRDEAGLSLIEVVFTALIVILISAATAKALIATSSAAGDEQFRSEANALAAQDQDQMRSLSDVQLDAIQSGSQPRTHPVQLGGITFKVVSGASFRSASGTSGASSCTASAAATYETTSTVSWTEHSLTHSVESDSLLARSVIGQLLVQVNSSTGPALPGVVITAAGTTPGSSQQSAQTNSAGCVLFAGLVPGPYAVTAAKSGYVNLNGNNSSTETVSVSSTGSQAPTFTLGVASGPINATYQSPASTAGQADGFSWLQTGMASAGLSSTVTSTTGTSTSNLYPGNYAVWGGKCPGQEPLSGMGSTVTVSPGQSVSASVIEPTLNITVDFQSGNTTYYLQPTEIVETYRSGGCIDSWASSVASTPMEPATGWLADPGQPYAAQGTLTVCADYYYASSNTWYAGTAPTTANSSFATTASANSVTVTLNINQAGRCAIQTS